MNEILTKKQRESLLKLVKSEDLIVTRPDKGSWIVLMDKTAYIERINALLSDDIKFQKLLVNTDTTKTTESLKNLKQAGLILSELS